MKNHTFSLMRKLFNFNSGIAGFLVVILTSFGSIPTIIAQSSVDSLLRLFNSSEPSENEKALICAKLADLYAPVKIDSAEYFAWYGLEISLRNKFSEGQFNNYLAMGGLKMKMDDFDEAKKFFLRDRKSVV